MPYSQGIHIIRTCSYDYDCKWELAKLYNFLPRFYPSNQVINCMVNGFENIMGSSLMEGLLESANTEYKDLFKNLITKIANSEVNCTENMLKS